MDELVAKRILFDFEIITLIALVIGVVVYYLGGSFKLARNSGIEARFIEVDLILMWLPLMFFLANPIFGYIVSLNPESANAAAAAASEAKSTNQQLIGGLNQLVSFAFIGVITVILIQLLTVRDVVEILGLRRQPLVVILIVGVVGAILSYVLCQGISHVSKNFLTDTLGSLEVQKPVEDMKNARTPLLILLTVFNACIAAPIVEETLFRGYFYPVLKKYTNAMFSGIITAGAFAVVHSNIPALVPLWFFAILLTLSYEFSRTIWVPILIHSLFNGINVLVLFIQKVP